MRSLSDAAAPTRGGTEEDSFVICGLVGISMFQGGSQWSHGRPAESWHLSPELPGVFPTSENADRGSPGTEYDPDAWINVTQTQLNLDLVNDELPTVCRFDPCEELLWVGTKRGQIMSFFVHPDLETYTRFGVHQHHQQQAPVADLVFDPSGIVSVTEKSLFYHSRGGKHHHLLDSRSAERLSRQPEKLFCGDFYPTNAGHLVIGGEKQQLMMVDCRTGQITSVLDLPHGVSTLHYAKFGLMCLGGTNGQISFVDGRVPKVVSTLDAHPKWVTRITSPLLGEGLAANHIVSTGLREGQTGSLIPDVFAKVFDVRTMKSQLHISCPSGAAFTQFVPRLSLRGGDHEGLSMLTILSSYGPWQQGEFTPQDLRPSTPNPKNSKQTLANVSYYRAHFYQDVKESPDIKINEAHKKTRGGSNLVDFDIATSGGLCAMVDSRGGVHIWQSVSQSQELAEHHHQHQQALLMMQQQGRRHVEILPPAATQVNPYSQMSVFPQGRPGQPPQPLYPRPFEPVDPNSSSQLDPLCQQGVPSLGYDQNGQPCLSAYFPGEEIFERRSRPPLPLLPWISKQISEGLAEPTTKIGLSKDIDGRVVSLFPKSSDETKAELDGELAPALFHNCLVYVAWKKFYLQHTKRRKTRKHPNKERAMTNLSDMASQALLSDSGVNESKMRRIPRRFAYTTVDEHNISGGPSYYSFPFSKFNRCRWAKISGLENCSGAGANVAWIGDHAINALVQTLYFINPLKLTLATHILSETEENIADELGFLFTALDHSRFSRTKVTQASRLVRAIRKNPRVLDAGLVASRLDSPDGVSISPAKKHLGWDKAAPQGFFLLAQFAHLWKIVLREADTAFRASGMDFVTRIFGVPMRKTDNCPVDPDEESFLDLADEEVTTYHEMLVDLVYPHPHQGQVQEFCEILYDSLRKSVVRGNSKSIIQTCTPLPPCLLLNANIQGEADLNLWKSSSMFLPPQLYLHFSDTTGDLLNVSAVPPEPRANVSIVYFELNHLTCHILGENADRNVHAPAGHMVAMVKVPRLYITDTLWQSQRNSMVTPSIRQRAEGVQERDKSVGGPVEQTPSSRVLPQGSPIACTGPNPYTLGPGAGGILPPSANHGASSPRQSPPFSELNAEQFCESPNSSSSISAERNLRLPLLNLEEDTTRESWVIINDFVITPSTLGEVSDFTPLWKTPGVVMYVQPGELESLSPMKAAAKENLKIPAYLHPLTLEMFLADRNLSMAPSAPKSPSTFEPLSEVEVQKLLNGGLTVALDTEFVALGLASIEIREDGTREVLRPGEMAVGRVSVLRGDSEGGREGVPFLDHYVDEDDIGEIRDYVTRFSGLRKGDLSRRNSPHWLTSSRSIYLKLRFLVECGCQFVGHGLRTDFRILNLPVPSSLLVDTVDLFHMPGQRYLSLRFLAQHVLGRQVQTGEHCSIEDAKTALALYKKYEHLKGDPDRYALSKCIANLYEIGRDKGWK